VLLKVGEARNEAHITGRLGRAAKGINPRAAIFWLRLKNLAFKNDICDKVLRWELLGAFPNYMSAGLGDAMWPARTCSKGCHPDPRWQPFFFVACSEEQASMRPG
jgi:hypothetical protein